jgi:O-acetyl-ADP-ribose deacetylase (regulator of RNase III)
MIRFTQGNLLEAPVEAVVNTVNTVGVMGKGIALMFKERFPENNKAYEAACKTGQVKVGSMFITPGVELGGLRWIINFPTKQNWRNPSRLEWVETGLLDLKEEIVKKGIRSLAIPPLGCGNGGLEWSVVKPMIEDALGNLPGVEVVVFEPTAKYQNIAKKKGVEKLTPARALIAEVVRRYWILGIECTLVETQKLAWFLERFIDRMGLENPLDLRFEANRYGPYAYRLTKLLEGLDGSYLHCDKRMTDAEPMDTVWFEDTKRERLEFYLKSDEARGWLPVLDATDALIDGFQSPLGMEVLATLDWLHTRQGIPLTLVDMREGLSHWPAGESAAQRKVKLFNERLLQLAIERLQSISA